MRINTDKIQSAANQVKADAASRYARLPSDVKATLTVDTYQAASERVFNMHLDALKADAHKMVGAPRFDADLLPIFARELEYVFSTVVEQPYPELRAAMGQLFPVNQSIPEGASSWIQYFNGTTGVAKFVNGSGTDRPLASLEGARILRGLASCALDYAYSYDELQAAAMMPGMRLDPMLAEGARRGHMQLLNDVLLWGNGGLNMVGLVNHPNISQALAADNGSGSTFWSAKTPAQIIADVNGLINGQRARTLGVYPVNRVLLPQTEYMLIATTKLGVGDGNLTILDFLRNAHPGVSFEELLELDAGLSNGNLSESCALAYHDRVVSGQTSVLFRQFGVQQINLQFRVPCHSRIGGIKLDAPIAVSRLNGIGAGL